MITPKITCDYCKQPIEFGNYKQVFSHSNNVVISKVEICEPCWIKAQKALSDYVQVPFYKNSEDDDNAALQ